MKPLTTFISKSGKTIEIWEPSLERMKSFLSFVNRLVEEDTFLTLSGRKRTYEEEETWLKNVIASIKLNLTYYVWAVSDDKIIGNCDIKRGDTRKLHVGTIGLMVDRDFRREGIGSFLFNFILEKGKKMGFKIATLTVFSDNIPGFNLYKKCGFD